MSNGTGATAWRRSRSRNSSSIPPASQSSSRSFLRIRLRSVPSRHGSIPLYPTLLEPQPNAPADRLRHIRDSIEAIAPHVPQGSPFVVITGAAPDGNIHAVLETARREFGELARFAEVHGVR